MTPQITLKQKEYKCDSLIFFGIFKSISVFTWLIRSRTRMTVTIHLRSLTTTSPKMPASLVSSTSTCWSTSSWSMAILRTSSGFHSILHCWRGSRGEGRWPTGRARTAVEKPQGSSSRPQCSKQIHCEDDEGGNYERNLRIVDTVAPHAATTVEVQQPRGNILKNRLKICVSLCQGKKTQSHM